MTHHAGITTQHVCFLLVALMAEGKGLPPTDPTSQPGAPSGRVPPSPASWPGLPLDF